MAKRVVIFVLAASMALLVAGVSASGDEHIPPHPHMLLLHADVEPGQGGPPQVNSYEKCIDLAGNNTLKLSSQHEHLHFGNVNRVAFPNAGHLIIPGLPFGGFEDCGDLADTLPPND